MSGSAAGSKPGIQAGRLSAADYERNFSDLHPPLSDHEALVESDRCYFCYDAPCTAACPTSIDIALFIRQIASGNAKGAAVTILEQNIMGGMCARVCPVETLCEEACVRNLAEDKPVQIGLLQRHATDLLMGVGDQPFARAAPTGKRVAVVGAGPAGLSCAHRLATHGHDVTVFESRDKAGGLNEYGIASYKAVDEFAQREVDFITGIGGIEIQTGQRLGADFTLDQLRSDFDGVFLGIGMDSVNRLGLDDEDLDGVEDAVSYIATLRQADDLSRLPVGRSVAVIGGGMTAIDVAVQIKHLGADDVVIAYRRGKDQMNASEYEQRIAQTNGVRILHWVQPHALQGEGGQIRAKKLERTRTDADGGLEGTGEIVTLEVDMVFKAVGQALDPTGTEAVAIAKGRIVVDENRRTSLQGVWAGGDCVAGGEDLTVVAVEDGKIAAEDIHRALSR